MRDRIDLAPDQAAESRPVVLVVEDEVMIRHVVAAYLRDSGFTVVEAVNASEAKELLASHNEVDIVFSDILMPEGIDGFALADWIDKHCEGLPLLLTSGSHAARSKAEGRQFISKPYIYIQLEKRLREMLGLPLRPSIDDLPA